MSKRLLMISTDRNIFQKGSSVRVRQAEYAKQFDEVHIMVFAGKEFLEEAIAPNCWVYPTRSSAKFMRPFDAIRLGRFIAAKKGITEITCQDPSFTAMAGIALKKEFGILLEIQIHEDIGSPYYGYSVKNKIRKSMALSYIPKADALRVVSKKIKTYLVETLKVDQSKITVRPIHVDAESIRTAAVVEQADLHKKYPQFEKIVLIASRLEKEKNIELALKAWPGVIAAFPKAGLLIVGRGSQTKNLKQLAAKLGISDSVLFEDWADRNTLISYYKTVDVFLNTSLFEGYGMTLIEAQAAGCKIVSTDVGVAREAGAHIVGWNENEIAQKITELL